jgi:uncharacterized membrane protein YhaH (DUF805 family)
MFCQKCDCENPDGAKFCSNCGTNIAALKISSRLANPRSTAEGSRPTFGQSISICLRKYADFNGRASRPEFWWFQLFIFLLNWGLLVLDNSVTLSFIFILGVWLPSLAVTARRLHDVGRSGWWMLISITVIGLVPFYYWMASKGDDLANEYGAPV